MTNELTTRKDEIAGFCEQFHVRDLFAFGSTATGDFVPGRSDFDFLVRFAPCEPGEHADRYFGLLEALQEMFGARVDLVEIDAIRNEYFREEVEQSRVRIYAA